MVEDEYLKEIDPEYLLGKIDMLQEILEELVFQMPERTMKIIEHHAKRYVLDLETEARKTGNAARKRYAAGAQEASETIINNADPIIDENQEGGRIRTIQPVPIDPRNWIDQDRQF